MALTKRPGFAAEVDSSETIISVDNSSITAINTGSNFTGEWEDVGKFSSVVVSVATDQNGYYEVQFSPDGTNADSTLTRYYRTDLINPPHRFTITRRYCRIRFFNDSGTNQTYFRLQTLFGTKASLNIPLAGTISTDYDAFVVRPTIPEDEIVLGRRQGADPTLKFGYNGDVDSASPEVVAAFGDTFTPMSSADTLEVVSDDVNDTSAGTGARTLLITGLDSNRRTQTEIVTMNGTTAVTTSNSYLGVNRVVVLSSGSGKENAGNISITETTSGNNQAYIPAGDSVTQQMIFHTQSGHQAMIKKLYLNVLKLAAGTAPRITAKLKVWNPGVTDTVYTIRRLKLDTGVSNDIFREYNPPLSLSPTDVVWLEVETNTNNTIVDAEMQIVEYRLPTT